MDNVMNIGGVSIETLVEKCETPLFVYDEKAIETRIEEYVTNFKSDTFHTEVIYASKAFTCIEMIKKIKDTCSLDVVSGGELFIAMKAGFDPNKIYFHGNNKTKKEIQLALKYGVKTFVLDNVDEVSLLKQESMKMNKTVHVLIRVNPKVEAHTHEFIMTATGDSKFGISIDANEQIEAMIKDIVECDTLVFDGFHSHIGSQIFEREAFVAAIEKMVEFSSQIRKRVNVEIHTLNLGGGFGVTYTSEDAPTPIPLMCETLIRAVEDACEKQQLHIENICIEPGRSMVAEAGYTLYEIGFTKKTATKEFAFVDGGMADNIRPALYEAKYHCELGNKMNEEKTNYYEIAGKCCESGDILIHDAYLPKVETNDILVVYSTGAYGYSMASNYNRLNRPAVVFVKDGKIREVIRRETYEDQICLDTNNIID